MQQLLLVMPILTALTAAGFYDRPDPVCKGSVTAKVTPIAELETVVLVEPIDRKVYEGKVDRNTRTFAITGLPPGKYGLILKFKGVVAEGVPLTVTGGFEKLSPEDLAGIEKVIFESEDFFNVKTIARLGGNGKKVKILVEQIRDRKTFDPGGAVLKNTMIRRIDLTEMHKTGQIWQIAKTRHLFRERRQMGGKGTTLTFLHVPKLGGIRVGDSAVTLPDIDLAKLKDQRAAYFHKAAKRIK